MLDNKPLTGTELDELRGLDMKYRGKPHPIFKAISGFNERCGGHFDFDTHHETREVLNLYRELDKLIGG